MSSAVAPPPASRFEELARDRTAAPLEYHMLIDGEWVASVDGATRESVDPFSGKAWAIAQEGATEDADRAVRSARRAFDDGSWRSLSGLERGRILRRLGDLIRRDISSLAMAESRDNGKTLRECKAGINLAADWYEYFGGWADKIHGDVVPVDGSKFHVYTLRRPVGVVAAITGFNSPLLIAAYKVAPALAVGCSVVLKPAEYTPAATLQFGALALEAGLPRGILNVITGGAEAGAALAGHPQVDKVSFTGSTATGKTVAKLAADALSPVALELGGKSPQLVFQDANVERAAEGVGAGIFSAGGQSCVAGSRLYVHEQLRDALVDALVARAGSIRLGDPFVEQTEMGPMAFERHMEGVLGAIEQARADGAQVVAGGDRVGGELSDGFFVEPTVLVDVEGATAAKEEIFGPVLSVMTFGDEEEAIAKANDSAYGLAAGVWTTNVGRAHRVAAALDAGTVWVNTYRAMNQAVPFGGFKQSGYGREQGFEVLREYTGSKSIWVNLEAEDDE